MADSESPPLSNAVLVVDDDPGVLRVISSTLAGAGYQVLIADSAAAGLQIFLERRLQICALVVDVVMQGMGGVEFAAAILEIDPAAKILLMSGYSEVAQDVRARTNFPFLRKPFLPTDL